MNRSIRFPRFLRTGALAASLLVLSLAVPILLLARFSGGMRFSFRFNPRITAENRGRALSAVRELAGYFRHANRLTLPEWTEKEKKHLKEVRARLDVLLGAALVLAAFLPPAWKRESARTAAWINLAILGSSFLLLPWFKPFWRSIFHPLLFANDLWKNTRADMSYVLFPRIVFLRAFVFTAAWAFLANGFVAAFTNGNPLVKQPADCENGRTENGERAIPR
jgi:hypothetical protein